MNRRRAKKLVRRGRLPIPERVTEAPGRLRQGSQVRVGEARGGEPAYWCGAHGCGLTVHGEAGKQRHLREHHPDVYGMLFIPFERPGG